MKTICGCKHAAFFFALVGLFVLVGILGPRAVVRAADAGDKPDPEGFKYEPSISGAPEDLADLLESLSDVFSKKEESVYSLRLLENRMEKDVVKMKTALDAHGYFKAAIIIKVAAVPSKKTRFKKKQKTISEQSASAKATAVFEVKAGPRFTITDMRILPDSSTDSKEALLPQPEELKYTKNMPYSAKYVVDAGEKLLVMLGDRGYAAPKLAGRDVTADHATDSVSVVYRIASGPRGVFGDTEITGLTTLEPDFVNQKLPWKFGQRYDLALVKATRTKLIKLGLFSKVDIVTGKTDEQGRVHMKLVLTERLRRTIRLGAKYTTDKGPGGHAEWENRNLFGRGELLRLKLRGDLKDQEALAEFRKPDFLVPNLDFVAKGGLLREDTDAYDSLSLRFLGALEYNLGGANVVGTGVQYRIAKVTKFDKRKEYHLLSVPTYFLWDATDLFLDPSRGGKVRLDLAPYMDVQRHDLAFLKTKAMYSHYVPLLPDKKLVFASRVSYGVITGAAWDAMPADELFYPGGGNSVRGYGYQMCSSVRGSTPLGGVSEITLSNELRYRITETIGLVAFLDGGRAYEEMTPDLNDPVFWGAGLGARYYTNFGPLRLDVGIPLYKRSVDDNFQIYVSLGQAF